METFEIILLLAFLLFSLFGRLFKKKPGKKPVPPPQPEGQPAEKPTFFEEILRELEQQSKPKSQPEPAPVPAKAEVDDAFAAEDAFEAAGRTHTPHEEHGFGSDSPFSEEAFERLPRDPLPPLHESGHLTDTPHVSVAKPIPSLDASAPSAAARRWRKRLRDPQSARDAIVLKEIFDGPATL